MRTQAALFFLLSFGGKWRAIKLICRFLVISTETCFFFGTFKETRCFVYFSFFCEFCSCFEFCSRCEFFINNEMLVINGWLCYYYNLNISFISIFGPSIQATLHSWKKPFSSHAAYHDILPHWMCKFIRILLNVFNKFGGINLFCRSFLALCPKRKRLERICLLYFVWLSHFDHGWLVSVCLRGSHNNIIIANCHWLIKNFTCESRKKHQFRVYTKRIDVVVNEANLIQILIWMQRINSHSRSNSK